MFGQNGGFNLLDPLGILGGLFGGGGARPMAPPMMPAPWSPPPMMFGGMGGGGVGGALSGLMPMITDLAGVSITMKMVDKLLNSNLLGGGGSDGNGLDVGALLVSMAARTYEGAIATAIDDCAAASTLAELQTALGAYLTAESAFVTAQRTASLVSALSGDNNNNAALAIALA